MKSKKFSGNKLLGLIVIVLQIRAVIFALLIYADWFIFIRKTSWGLDGAIKAFYTVDNRLGKWLSVYLVLSYGVIISIILVSVAKKYLFAPASRKGEGI